MTVSASLLNVATFSGGFMGAFSRCGCTLRIKIAVIEKLPDRGFRGSQHAMATRYAERAPQNVALEHLHSKRRSLQMSIFLRHSDAPAVWKKPREMLSDCPEPERLSLHSGSFVHPCNSQGTLSQFRIVGRSFPMVVIILDGLDENSPSRARGAEPICQSCFLEHRWQSVGACSAALLKIADGLILSRSVANTQGDPRTGYPGFNVGTDLRAVIPAHVAMAFRGVH